MLDLIPTSPLDSLDQLLSSLERVAPLFDAIPGVVFFVKDTQARYALVNQTLVQRCGCKEKRQLVGRTAEDVFPARFGPLYTAQDRRVLADGRQLSDQLELHLYYGNRPVWCLTHKIALRDSRGTIIGLAGISRDLQTLHSHPAYQKLAEVDGYIREHFARPITLEELTAIAGLSVAQLERYCKKIFQLTPRQMIHKARLGEASRLLREHLSITEVALRCGYTDHSAFSRQFRALTGVSPSQYRESQQ
ncbi:AraC family transcriptional regulator [Pseudomonas sp. GD03842]|uniref:AraC family transcriptional regulator n=1 Tax=unclassified Pseudomonas TaxID=196821 RepID=UPI000D35F800|nr:MULTISPECIES: AraC family transcriptional regulator [unclassified Pseudomonas]MDH0748292.1 AraC family transcriptional regulator [Pseudomonas sp. GD03842]RAU47554.1 AraC family transcriptional regulator [Pseudomonas sp. RIT 409]RAU49055.1 AraC family transcriptional regulator [Pseudomonas sp. RIT 412]